MESLKKQLDFKLVFDILCEPNGMVLLDKLSNRWPSSEKGAECLAQSCMKHWTRAANPEGFLTWESFCSGLQDAIRAENASDKKTLGKSNGSDTAAAGNLYVTTESMEALLSKCERKKLLEALIRSRKEVYSQHHALQGLTSPSRREHPSRRAAGTDRTDRKRAVAARSSSFSGSRESHTPTPAGNPGLSASLAILTEVESTLKDKLTLPGQCSTKLPLLQEALKQLQTLVQSLDLSPEQSQASAVQQRRGQTPAGTRPASVLVPSTTTHPKSLILPSKSEPHSIGAIVSSRSFSPKKHVQPANQPMRVDRSISHPVVAMKNPSLSHTPPPDSPKARLRPSTTSSTLTDYPRMRAALSLSSLPTSKEPSVNTNPTRSMLEQWKNSQLMHGGSGSRLHSTPTSQRASTPELRHRPNPGQQPQYPSHPHAVVEFPSAMHNTQHPLSASKHSSQQYLSSPNLISDPTQYEEALQQQQYGTIRRGRRNLSQALNEQSAQIHRLQSEKEALIRHLFHQQAQGYSSADDSVMSVL